MKRVFKILLPFIIITAVFVLYNLDLQSRPMYSDTEGHWAEMKIEKWSDYGVITGSYDRFRPDEGVTRAELCTIISRVVELGQPAENVFSDVEDGQWYTENLLRCIAAGVLEPVDGLVEPHESLTRQEGLDMLARALGMDEGRGMDMLSRHYWQDSDVRSFGYSEEGFSAETLEQLRDGCLEPDAPLSRAELVFMLDACQAEGYIEMQKKEVE